MSDAPANRLAGLLQEVGDAAASLGTVLDGDAKVVAAIATAALRFAEDIARQGGDPIAHIERIHAADPLLVDVEDAWAEALRERFGSGAP